MSLKEQDIVFTTKDANGNTVIQMPITRVENVEGAVKTVNGVSPDANGAVTVPTDFVPLSGARGQLAGYETVGSNTTINASSPDANQTGSAITVSNGTSGTSWTKIVRLTSAVTVTLGSSWAWMYGEAPTISAGGILVLCWCGGGGIANFVSKTA